MTTGVVAFHEDRDGVIWVWSAYGGYAPATPYVAAWLRLDRLARRYGRSAYRHGGTLRRTLPAWARLD